jgi:SecD/SecF fusion protein
MQIKGAIKTFAIAMAIVSLYQLSFTYVAKRVESKAEAFGKSEAATRQANELARGKEVLFDQILDSVQRVRQTHYLDSMNNKVVYNILIDKYTYKDAKDREINLGLDLKGGMNVVLEVSVIDIIKALSGNSQDPVFLQAVEKAKLLEKSSQKDLVTLFGESFESIDPNARLAALFLFEFRDKGITVNSTNSEVLTVIRQETDAAIDRTFQILRTRIDRFGVTQPNIQKMATSGRILVELPGIKDPKRVRKLLQGTAQLEFWETYNFSDLNSFFDEANQRLSVMNTQTTGQATATSQDTLSNQADNIDKASTAATANSTTESKSLLDKIEPDSTAAKENNFEEYAAKNPLYAYLSPAYVQNESGQYFPGASARVGTALVKDTAVINAMLRKVISVFPRNLKLAWSVKPRVAGEGVEYLELVALKGSRDNRAALGGEVIVDARQDFDQNGRCEVTIQMNSEGAKSWKRLTGENIGRQVAIVLDNYVYSFPVVNDEIPNGRSSISGGEMSIEEGQDLANILKAGKLPAPSRIVEEAVVGPTLGQEAIDAGLWSFVVAFMLTLAYMIFYYNRAGLIANVALFVNLLFVFGILASLGAVLTLPGIAGIVLTLGMDVDKNVIIYERIREELRAGKGMRLAIDDGYKHAYSAIIDSNITTLLTGIVLYIFGSGPVQGFATTLIIGVLSSLFCAIFITRLLFTYMLDNNKTISLSTRFTEHILTHVNINFIGIRKTYYVISGVLILIGIVSLGVRGLSYGIDFKGGRTYVVRFDHDVRIDKIRQALLPMYGQEPEVKTFGGNNQVKITTSYLIDDQATKVDSIVESKLYEGVKGLYNEKITEAEFLAHAGGKSLGKMSSQKIQPVIAYSLLVKAYYAVFISLLIIFGYIVIRFRKWQWGLGAVVSLFHDTFIVVTLFSLLHGILPFSLDIDQHFIAAILTIIGYSIMDSVIIFDRIREYTVLHPKQNLQETMNAAINSTLGRTLNTSGITFMVLLAMFLFGGEVIRGFTFALLVGVAVGTYSSILNATPIAYDTIMWQLRRNEKKSPVKVVKK